MDFMMQPESYFMFKALLGVMMVFALFVAVYVTDRTIKMNESLKFEIFELKRRLKRGREL